jgi:hypothetical protein
MEPQNLWTVGFPTEADIEAQAAAGAELGFLLESIVRAGEAAFPGTICTILLMSPDGRHLRHGAAPSMPTIYNQAIDGLEIGAGIGCCGQAAFTRKRVVVGNVRTHPNWTAFLELAEIYHRTPRMPDAAEFELMVRGAALARAAIDAKSPSPAL